VSYGRYTELVTHTTHAVLDSPGHTDPKLRWAVAHHRMDEVPGNLASYVEMVRNNAYTVTDDSIEELKSSGYTEDDIFELTASAALGAALMRLERGLIALHESKP
jgi:alkylhydroperoxidase family enzyme